MYLLKCRYGLLVAFVFFLITEMTQAVFAEGKIVSTSTRQSVKEKKVNYVIDGKITLLPLSKKVGNYFNARSATDCSITVQFGIQSENNKGLTLLLLQKDREVARTVLKGRFGRFTFDGLQPETEYTAVADFPTGKINVPCRTQKTESGKPVLKLAVLGDTHVSIIKKPGGRLHFKSTEILESVCEDANRRRCGAMIIAGDVTDANLSEEYVQAKQTLSEYRGVLMTVPGNHDDTNINAEIWRSHFGSDAGLESVNGIQFLRLNTANGKLNKPSNLAAIEKLDPTKPAIIFSHMQLVPDDYLNDKGKVIRDADKVQPQLEKIGRSKAVIYIGHKNVATQIKLGQVEQYNIPQTTQFPAGWLEVDIYPEGLVQRFVPSCPPELEEFSRLLGGGMMKGIGYRDVYSFDIWNRFVPWPNSQK